jgi:hypothetical protein
MEKVKIYFEINSSFFNGRTANAVLAMLAKFTAKDMCRPNIEHIFYDAEKKRLVATDGRGLLMVDTNNEIFSQFNEVFLDKNLDIVYLKSQKAIVFSERVLDIPKYEKVVPDYVQYSSMDIHLVSEVCGRDFARFYIKSQVCINPEYIDKLKGFSWGVYYSSEGKATVFIEKNLGIKAVIMPMYMEE